MTLYLEKGGEYFVGSLNHWFDYKNMGKWIQKYNTPVNPENVDNIYADQNNWCIENNINYTPLFLLMDMLILMLII